MLRALVPLVVGIIWLVVATVLAGFLPSHLPPPDVVLIVVVVFGFKYPLPLGGALAFVLGMLQDVLSGGVIGLNAFSKTVVFSLTRAIARRFYFPNWASKIAMVFLAGVVDGLLVAGIVFIGGGVHGSGAVLARQLLLQIIFTGLLSPLVLFMTPQVSDLDERGAEDIFHYGTTKTRHRRI